jgi:hypothetical protein
MDYDQCDKKSTNMKKSYKFIWFSILKQRSSNSLPQDMIYMYFFN